MYFVLLIILLTASAVDLATNRIPNRIAVCGILAGILCRLVRDGSMGVLISISGIFFPSLLLMFLYAFQVIGAGDVKLMSAVGSFLGIYDAFGCLIPILFFAGGLSFLFYLFILFHEKRNAFLRFHVIPMAVPIFLGVFWYLCRTGAV